MYIMLLEVIPKFNCKGEIKVENKNHSCGCGHNHDHEVEELKNCECGGEGECDCDGDCDCHDEHGHHHDHDHGCGCGHDHDHNLEEEYETIRLVLDDEKEMECFVLEIFTIGDDEQEYIALLPKGEESVLIYRFNEDAEDEPQLINIEDEEEFQKVSEVFMQIMDGEEAEE